MNRWIIEEWIAELLKNESVNYQRMNSWIIEELIGKLLKKK